MFVCSFVCFSVTFALDIHEDMTADRDEVDDADGCDDGGMDLQIAENKVIPFPHEHHWTLAQEWLNVFGGAGEITLIDSFLKLLI